MQIEVLGDDDRQLVVNITMTDVASLDALAAFVAVEDKDKKFVAINFVAMPTEIANADASHVWAQNKRVCAVWVPAAVVASPFVHSIVASPVAVIGSTQFDHQKELDAVLSGKGVECRVCKVVCMPADLIRPCKCTDHVHRTCIQNWVTYRGTTSCDVCLQTYSRRMDALAFGKQLVVTGYDLIFTISVLTFGVGAFQFIMLNIDFILFALGLSTKLLGGWFLSVRIIQHTPVGQTPIHHRNIIGIALFVAVVASIGWFAPAWVGLGLVLVEAGLEAAQKSRVLSDMM